MDQKIFICPLTKQPGCNLFHMIGKDGGLKHSPHYMILDMEKQGWRQVTFPKRSYYYEYDVTHPSYRQRELIGLEDNTDILKVTVL